MEKTIVKKIIENLEADLKKLSKVTGVKHLNCILINGTVMIDDFSDLDFPKFKYYHRGDIKCYEEN